MSENCNHDCTSCGENCKERDPKSFLEPLHPKARVRKVIGVVSGKGGVGKSMVTSLLALSLQRKGYRTAILDADITGPSIPKAFGIREKAVGNDEGILPSVTPSGIQMMSINLLLPSDTDPVIWRGPVISGTVKQFWSEVLWDNVDYMLVDMPPGTGDVPLTVFQSLPLSGVVVVTSPQELVGMIVEKAVKMAAAMQVPVLGVVENMSYFVCPDCNRCHPIFGESHVEETAARLEIPTVAKLPVDPSLATLADKGRIEEANCPYLEGLSAALE